MSIARSHMHWLGIVGLFAGVPAAQALPQDRIITSHIRETPWDESSPVRTTVSLHISAVDQNENAVAWMVTKVEIVRVGQDGAADAIWRDDAPTLSAPGGLWWVEHADPNAPANGEFKNQPEVFGNAAPVENASEGLVYSLMATESTSNQFDGNVADAFYWIASEQNPQDPIEEGEDEPVETEGTIDPS